MLAILNCALCTVNYALIEYLILDGLHAATIDEFEGIDLHIEALVDNGGEFDGKDRRQPHIAEVGRETKAVSVEHIGDDALEFLFKNIERSIATSVIISSILLYPNHRSGQGTLVNLLILIERNAVNLHGSSRHHVRRLVFGNEGVERLDINQLVAHYVSHDILASAGVVESLHGGILDVRKLSDNTLNLFELDAETTYLDLSVATTYELDVAILTTTHDIASAIDTSALPLDKDLSSALGLVEITQCHLWTTNNQFALATILHLFTLWVDDV